MIVRREVFEAVGLLDEGYFMYFEEVDFCHRARRAGWPCWYVPAARVVHLVGQSTGEADRAGRSSGCRATGSSRAGGTSCRTTVAVATFLADLAWSLGHASYRLRRRVQRKPDTDPRWLLWDFIRFNFLLARR